MLEFLKSAPFYDATEAGHHSIQVIRQWAAVASREDPLAIEDSGLNPTQVELVKRIIRDVENRAGRAVGELVPKERAVFVSEISSNLLDLSKQQFQIDTEDGKTLLEKLRSTESKDNPDVQMAE